MYRIISLHLSFSINQLGIIAADLGVLWTLINVCTACWDPWRIRCFRTSKNKQWYSLSYVLESRYFNFKLQTYKGYRGNPSAALSKIKICLCQQSYIKDIHRHIFPIFSVWEKISACFPTPCPISNPTIAKKFSSGLRQSDPHYLLNAKEWCLRFSHWHHQHRQYPMIHFSCSLNGPQACPWFYRAYQSQVW